MLVALALTVQAHRRSTELADMQTDFVAHVSHQLKTPLSLLSAATETLQMDRIRSPEKLGEYLDTIRAEAARLSTLVQRVLEFSRVQQQRSYEFEHVDFGALTRETVDAFAHGLSRHHVTFNVHLDGPGPVRARRPRRAGTGARQPARQRGEVFGSDQGDHGPPVGRAQPGDRRDCGPRRRRASADQARIFERFYRAPSAAHRPGFGLGLPIVRELVHAHGGRVDMRSTPGVGSTFRVSLPRVAAAAIEKPPPALESTEAAL